MTLGEVDSCCIKFDGDVTRTKLSSTRGGGWKGKALATSLATIAYCRWVADRVTLDVTMLDEFDDISVWGGNWDSRKRNSDMEFWIKRDPSGKIHKNKNSLSIDSANVSIRNTNFQWNDEMRSPIGGASFCCDGENFEGWPPKIALQCSS